MSDIRHWTALKRAGNKFRLNVNRAMLTPDGFVETVYPKTRDTKQRTQLRVLYDRRYIAEKFAREWLQPLNFSWEEFVTAMKDMPFPVQQVTEKESQNEAG